MKVVWTWWRRHQSPGSRHPCHEGFPPRETIANTHVPAEKKVTLVDFLTHRYNIRVDLQPLVVVGGVNDAPRYDCQARPDCEDHPRPRDWPPFVRGDLVQKLDASTGASLKLAVLNREVCIGAMVAGGAAYVILRRHRCIAAHGCTHGLANYGEYSGAPPEGQAYEYAKMNIQSGALPAQVEQAAPIPDANETVGAIHPDGGRTQASEDIVHFDTKVTQSGRP
ncbi:hypothetical protein EST38_g11582 [Candolleomyces aberdarensis]|uniref:ATP-citrate synthase citrate-binding domain-containing protein n=1 Tax=Candolleomyces aberdarensis TaxID=2316362 RepID=A0A4Q2D7T7_9AGAR|nr:hypothetical protein EST38_g11582 [Candolleomyces aberdarensis]